MAHVSIISSQSGEQIFEGAPRYIGAYLKPGYLEFQAIGSPTAISWHVGDYVVYPRTGKTYRLYRTPQIAEQGDTMRYGAAFLYENVQFFDDSKRLELCPFTDLVPGDNTIHFSTQNVVSFFGKPLNVAERVQACLENQYGAGTWEVRIVTTTAPDLLELLDTEVEFSVSGASCQQALDKVYELWNGLGWIHTVENGVNVITIGASNVRTNANTTVPFAYDNGLVRVERSIANADQIGTRLFAYGSMKNMDATYYRGLDIKDAESVDIEHLMIPLANWGLTDNKPDARKAFIEDAAAIAKLGLIPRTAYFDGTGDLPDIHPTIERMTIGEVYDAGGAGYIPNLSKWSRDQRIDEIVSAVNPTDHGTSAEQGQKYTEDISSHLAALTDTFINNDTVSWTIFSVNTNNPGRLTLNFGQEPQPITLTTAWTPQLDLKLAVYAGGKRVEAPLTIRQASSTAWQIILPESVTVSGALAGLVEARIEGVITNTAGGQTTVEGSFSTNASTAVTGGVEYELPKTFTVTIPQIGFDIEKYAALGNGKTISMKTGMCAGRDFEIKSAKYVSSTDSWLLTLYRSSDEDLGIMFPNADYQIAAGDQYVLLDIAMPDMYVTVASNRLLEAARKLLADISSERPFYSPQIDAKVVYNESRVLLEGMWMDVAFDSSREYVLVDSITIDENGSNIPTYEVSLRERKGIEWTENVGKSSSSRSSVSVNGGDTEQTGGVRSVGMTVPTGLTVQGSPITGAGIFKVGLAEGYKIPLVSELANYFELAADPTLVQLRQAYSYLGPRKGLIFEANEEADANADFEKVALPGGGYALHSRLPFYSDSFISAGGISPGGGASAGNATLVAQTYGGTLSATGIDEINFYSKEKVDQLLLTAGTVQTVAGVSPTSGDIPVASLKSALGLGAAAEYGIGSVASGNTGLVTGGSVYSAINEAVSSVMKMQGTTTTPISDGSTTNPVVIDGSSYTAKKGDVVLYDGKEYLWAGSAWEQLGDEASWALKTTTIYAGTGLEGGGTLASNRTISLSAASIASLALADSAYQKPSTGIPQTDLASGVQTSLGKADSAYQKPSTGIPQTDLASALSTKIDHGESAYTNLNDWFGIDDDGNIYVKKNGNTARGFYSYGFVSAGGVSSSGGASGVDLTAVWNNLIANTGEGLDKKIHTAHLPTVTITGTNISGTATYSGTGGNASTLTLNLTATDTTYSAGTGISIDDTTISNSGVRSTTINGNYLRVNTNGTNADLTIPYATTASRLPRTNVGAEFDLNTALSGGGLAYNYGSVSYWVNGPSGMSYGGVAEISQNGTALSAQFAWDIVHNVENGTRSLWYRAANNLGWCDWAEIYTSKSLTQTVVTNLIGTTTYAPYNSAGYLPLTGGQMAGTIWRKMTADTSNYENAIGWQNSAGSSTLAYIGYHNTVQKIFINAIGASEPYTDTVGKYSLVVGNNVLTYNTYPILRSDNYTTWINTTNFPGLSKVGTVTSVAAGTGLSGGTITTSGTISLAASGVTAGTYYKTTVDTYGRVTSGAYANLSAAINGDLTEGSSNPVDADFYISQYAGGGTSTTSYHRRPHSALYGYIKGKLDSVYVPLTRTVNSKTLSANITLTLDDIGNGSTRSLANYLPLNGGTMSNTNVVTNLNADLLDGLHATAFVRWYNSTTTDFTSYFPTAQIVTKYGSTDGLSGDGAVVTIPTWSGNNANNYYNVQFVFGLEPTTFTIRAIHSGSVNYTNTVYTTANANLSTVPWACSTLAASGNITLYNSLNFTSADWNYLALPANGSLHLSVGGSVMASMYPNGNVGIGTSPTEKLTVNGTILSSMYRMSSEGTLAIWTTSEGTDYSSYGPETVAVQTCFDEQDPLTSSYVASYSDRCRLVLQPRGGLVGIGTYAPTQALHVVGNILATGAITAGSASDARLKTNIQSLSAEAAKRIVMALNPVTFTWNSTATELYDQYKGDDLGFIAQEVEPYLPQAIGSIFEKYKRLDQTKVIAPLVAVAKDHETRIRQLERENAELKRRLNMN